MKYHRVVKMNKMFMCVMCVFVKVKIQYWAINKASEEI